MMFMCRICSKKYRCLKKLLRLLLGGVGWGLGTLFAGQGRLEIATEIKEEMKKGKSPEVLQKFDFPVKVHIEESGMKEVKNLKDDNKVEVFDAEVNNGKVRLRLISKKAEVEQSRPAKWDPGQLFGAKDQMEMLNVEEVTILVNINKVGLQLFMKEVWSSGGAIEKALLIVMFLLKERFVNGFSPLSDYG